MNLETGLVEEHKGNCDEDRPSNEKDSRIANRRILLCLKSVVKRANFSFNFWLIKLTSIHHHNQAEEEGAKVENR